MALKHFTPSTNWWSLTIWGGGHTPATDPTQRGWCAYRAPRPGRAEDLVLVGQRGVPGCFSARPLPDGKIDVAVYDEPPEEVVRAWNDGTFLDAGFRVVENIPGWGLTCVEWVEGMR